MLYDYYGTDFNSFRYISHYGVIGMKWGVRRFQNPDGSLKAAGKGRYDGEPMPKSQLGKVTNSKETGSKTFTKRHTSLSSDIRRSLIETRTNQRDALDRRNIAMENRGYVFDGEKYTYVGSASTREGRRLKYEAEKKLRRMEATSAGRQKLNQMSKEVRAGTRNAIGASEYRKTLREIDRKNNSFSSKMIGSKRSILIKDLDSSKYRYN